MVLVLIAPAALADWYPNLLERVEQLVKWSETLITPSSVWLCGLFNPMAFVTAVMQVTARKKQWALDNVTLETHITAYEWNGLKPDGIDKQPEESAYVHGMYLQGARWDTASGMLKDSFLKELLPPLPVMNIVAIPLSEKKTKGLYTCPVYYTGIRGSTFTFEAQLKTGALPDNTVVQKHWFKNIRFLKIYTFLQMSQFPNGSLEALHC